MAKKFIFPIVRRRKSILVEVSSFYGRKSIVLLLGEVSEDSNVRKSGFRKLVKIVSLDRHLCLMIFTAFSREISSLVDIVNSVDIVYGINSVYSFQSIFVFVFWLSCFLQMGRFTAKCACANHDTWHHGEVSADNLRVVAANELRYCDYDASKNKNRKRKICLACRGKIVLEIKCARLEVSESLHIVYMYIGRSNQI